MRKPFQARPVPRRRLLQWGLSAAAPMLFACAANGSRADCPPEICPRPNTAADAREPPALRGRGYRLARNWDFGTAPGKSVRDTRELWRQFEKSLHYDRPPGHLIGASSGGWERMYGYDKNVIFTPHSLILRYDCPSGVLGPGRIEGAGLHSWGKFEFRYGYLEMRVKIPDFEKTAVWSAGWVIPADSTNRDVVELDLFEFYNKPDATRSHWGQWFITVHGSGSAAPPLSSDKRFVRWETPSHENESGGGRFAMAPEDPYRGFHTYGVDWQRERADFYLDGRPVLSRRFAWRRADGSEAPPGYIVLDASIGGPYPGFPTDAAEFPADLEVEFIRVWQR